MPVRVRFRCQFCDTAPGAETQRSLERGLRELVFGEYLDARSAGWSGTGAARSARRATPAPSTAAISWPTCASTTARSPAHPWKMPPYATSRRSRDTELAIARGGLSPMPKWGLPS